MTKEENCKQKHPHERIEMALSGGAGQGASISWFLVVLQVCFAWFLVYQILVTPPQVPKSGRYICGTNQTYCMYIGYC